MIRAMPSRRTWRYTAFVLLCSLGAVVCVDRLTAVRVEHKVSEAFRQATGAAGSTSVHVEGVPVITQVLSGQLAHVDLNSGEIPASGSRPVPITRLSLRMDGLRAYRNSRTAHVSSVRGNAYFSYGDLSDALGLRITPDRDPRRVDAEVDLPLAGQVTLSAELTVADATSIAFRDPRVVGDLPPGAAAMATHLLEQPITLRNLPHGLKLEGLSTNTSGANAKLAGRDVTFTPDSGSGTAGVQA